MSIIENTSNKAKADYWQILKADFEFKQEAEILDLLEADPELRGWLSQTQAKIKAYFPENRMALEQKTDINDNHETGLIIWLYPAGPAWQVLAQFEHFKQDWFTDFYLDQIEERIRIYVEHPDFLTSGDPSDLFEGLVGTIEGPADWSAEHDHYLYGTPKHYEH